VSKSQCYSAGQIKLRITKLSSEFSKNVEIDSGCPETTLNLRFGDFQFVEYLTKLFYLARIIILRKC